MLKNAIDQARVPGPKPAGLLGVSTGTPIYMLTLGQPEAFIWARDELFDEVRNIGTGSKKFFQVWMD